METEATEHGQRGANAISTETLTIDGASAMQRRLNIHHVPPMHAEKPMEEGIECEYSSAWCKEAKRKRKPRLLQCGGATYRRLMVDNPTNVG